MAGLFGGGAKASQAPPAIGALNVQQSSYGTPVTLGYGTNRITGNLLWYDDFTSVQVSSGSSGGGKGGGGTSGGGGTYNYYASFLIGLCEGPISKVGQIWESKAITDVNTLGGTTILGTLGQAPWGYLTSAHPDKALGYNETAAIGFADFFLGTSADLPNISVETFFSPDTSTPSKQDAWPATVITDFLTRSAWPVQYLSTLAGSSFDTYCKAMSFGISPIIDQQRLSSDWLTEWITSLNSEFVWSDGVLSIVPYGDAVVSGNGVTFTPSLTPEYDLDEDDFIITGDEDPVTCNRTDLADAYNQIPIEYINRANQYNIETYTAEDAAHVDMYGIRTGTTVQAHHITDPSLAQVMAKLIMWRQIAVRTTYQFKLGWKHFRLDPMDLVTLTDPMLGLNRELVRITDIEEDENGMLTMTAEEMPGDIAAPAIYPSQATVRYNANYNADPGDVNVPVIFEVPLALIQSASVEVWMGLSGQSANWGGCDIYISTDGDSYKFLDRVHGRARQGVLTAQLPTSTVMIDTANTLAVNLAESLGVIGSATPADANALNSLCYVDGELLAFGQAILSTQYNYNLSYLQRGAYGSPISAHASGKPFLRLDQAVFKYDVDQSRIGQTIYFKFISFNMVGGAIQSLSDVAAYPYKILGSALLAPLPNPTNLSVNYRDNIAQLNWTPVVDIRSTILYQIRKGATFNAAQVIDTTAQSSYSVYGNDTYWVTAIYFTPLGTAVYSVSPASIAVTAGSLQQNLIETFEESPSWTGTVDGGAEVVGSTVQLQSGNILGAGNILTIPNVLQYTDVVASGSYTAPSGHTITSNYIVNAKVIFNWKLDAESATSDITAIADLTTTTDITGLVSASLVYAIPQVRLSTDGGSTYGSWQNWHPGVYTFNAIQYRILIYTLDDSVIAVLSQFSIEVDVPQRIDVGTSTSSAGADVTVAYPNGEYNVTPNVQITIQNKQNGDYDVLVSSGLTNFVYSVYNAGSRVVRTINHTDTGY